jgi:hypothetical protein
VIPVDFPVSVVVVAVVVLGWVVKNSQILSIDVDHQELSSSAVIAVVVLIVVAVVVGAAAVDVVLVVESDHLVESRSIFEVGAIGISQRVFLPTNFSATS